MINQSKIDDERFWERWEESGAVGTANLDRYIMYAIFLSPSKNIGEAYAFFNCDVSRNGLEQTLPYARRDAQTPRELELAVYEGSSQLKFDNELRRLLEWPDDYRVTSEAQRNAGLEPEAIPLSSLKYTLAARFPGQTNERAAEELRNVMGLILPGNLTQDMLRCGIVYKAEDGAYSLM